MVKTLMAAAISLLALPAFAQTTTTTTVDPQAPQAAPSPSTQVVVNPQQNAPPPPQVVVNPPPPQASAPAAVQPADPPPPVVVRDDTPFVETRPSGRSAVAIVATDGLYGGIAGGVVGGGVTLIDQGHNWARDIMVGAGIGVLIGASYGIYEAATEPRTVVRAVADRNGAASDSLGVAPAQYASRF